MLYTNKDNNGKPFTQNRINKLAVINLLMFAVFRIQVCYVLHEMVL